MRRSDRHCLIVGFLAFLAAVAAAWVVGSRPVVDRPKQPPFDKVWLVDFNGVKHEVPAASKIFEELKPIGWAMSLDLLHGQELETTRWAFVRECERNPKLSFEVEDLYRLYNKLERLRHK